MNKTVTITNLVGSEPYGIFLCNDSYTTCIYIDTINDSDIPYTFMVPPPFKSLDVVGIIAVDSNDCRIKDIITL